jgi:hypothetical protein
LEEVIVKLIITTVKDSYEEVRKSEDRKSEVARLKTTDERLKTTAITEHIKTYPAEQKL